MTIFPCLVVNGTTYRFEFSRGEATWEVMIEGSVTALQPIVDKLGAGKRESIRQYGEGITSITWRDITPKEE